MQKAPPRPASGEAPLGAKDILYSRTDGRGVIDAASPALCRVVDMGETDLVGAAHSILRHPEMPAAVFRHIWDRLKQREPAGAYIKNKTKDGLHYWVYAVFLHSGTSILSCQVKPKAPLPAHIAPLYASILAEEAAARQTPEKCAAALLAGLEESGHPGDNAFMGAALVAEMAARRASHGAPEDRYSSGLSDLAAALAKMKTDSAALSAQFKGIRGIPTNLRIAAVRLGDAGLPLIAISENYSLMVRDIWGHLETISQNGKGGFSALMAQVADARFLVDAAMLQEEAANAIRDSGAQWAAAKTEAQHLEDTAARTLARALELVVQVTSRIVEIARAFDELKRLVSGLDMTRVLCRVESGRLASSKGEALGGIIDHLDSFHSAVGKRLKDLDQLSDDVQRIGGALTRSNERSGRARRKQEAA